MNYQPLLISSLKKAIKIKKLEKKYKNYKDIEKDASISYGFWGKLLEFYNRSRDFGRK